MLAQRKMLVKECIMAQTGLVKGQQYEFQLNIKDLLTSPRFSAGKQEIVYRDKMRYTYRDLFERINRLGSALNRLGVKKGDTVAVFDYDSHRYLESYFAVPMLGAVLFTVNWRLSPDQIEYIMNHAQADVVLIHADFLPILASIKDRLKTIKKVVLLSDSPETAQTGPIVDTEYERMLAGSSPEYDFPELDENTMATLFYTTGTTGLPKGVFFSHRQLVIHTLSTCTAICCHETPNRFSTSDVYMPITPMFHVHAWGFPYIATMMGVKQVYPGKYDPETLLRLIAEEKVTYSHCVPTILQMLVTCPMIKEFDLSSWKCITGGSRLPKALARAALDLGIEVMTGYGMSETCPVISIANLKPSMKDMDNEQKSEVVIKAGMPIPLMDVRIVALNGEFLPADGSTTGQVVVRSPWLTKGYYKDKRSSENLWYGGWLHTGDVAHMDPDGYIQITDRLKDVIKTGGEWISSLDLENAITTHEAVQEAAAIGIPDPTWGERPLLIVKLKPEFEGQGITPEVLQQFMKNCAAQGKIPKYAVPDQYIIVPEIPKTSVVKIDKTLLRSIYTKD